ncbi:aldose 1-epimerase family protein [Rhizosphaericola mali]|uniref:Aldose 1-epimerase family protein n=1 Tax=Rhizosphaericola mali TaxID=2545455 RepID=A0A5P2GDS0_9BACT|nr:aldose 1-epimerase family protein [Rhizosphaericola mali]QES89751.1 aldose 1-epimerase family protein [Rhizosphaericola mali]
MIYLENNFIKAGFVEKGAELQSLINKETGVEYMWGGDPVFWGKHSPVLFPIVGGLKDNEYSFGGNKYSLGRHGFARDSIFSVIEQTETSISFGMSDTADSLTKYPFHFQFLVQYTINKSELIVKYIVKNMGKDAMYFSVGAHPAFNVPLNKDLTFEDYSLKFEKKETVSIYPLDDSGQTKINAIPFLNDSDELPLHKSLFYKDALVFKELVSDKITIQTKDDTHGITIAFKEYPYMGIWSAKDADFLCIEPWDGIADNEAVSGVLEEKEGIKILQAAQVYESSWSISIF